MASKVVIKVLPKEVVQTSVYCKYYEIHTEGRYYASVFAKKGSDYFIILDCSQKNARILSEGLFLILQKEKIMKVLLPDGPVVLHSKEDAVRIHRKLITMESMALQISNRQ